MKIRVGIVGVTGYAGGELLRILLRHPAADIQYLGSRQVTRALPVGELLSSFRDVRTLSVQPFRVENAAHRCDLLFLALPNGVAMNLAPRILRKPGRRVIDLSADFRFRSAGLFASATHLRHAHPALLRQAVYGLTEWARQELPSARLIANPGCYPTAVLLGLLPLAREGLLKEKGLLADAKSGVTGAGRGLKEELLFSEVNEDLRAYRVNAHPHIPEMEQALGRFSKRPISLTFVPHLVPMNRGLYATLYAPLVKSITEKRLRSLFCEAYLGEPFIRILPEGVWPQTKAVAGTNNCHIGLRLDAPNRRAIILVAIDNLGKGAAGQAVQNMNLLYGYAETQALSP